MTTHLGVRDEFIQNNLGLVHACAGRFRGRGIEYDDLYSAGCMGLIKAYDGFDTSRGVCFSTYAVPVILGEIKKLFRDGGTVKVSRSLKELGLKVTAARERIAKQTGQEPGVAQLAELLGESPETVALAIRASMPAVSLTP
ncbi:MAG: sigma-70 family RNA polymerase sigma factor, partial [Faecalibacterium sp.]|nr:sigma-70 family RNA polymerase sigma factor [Faecalibacterium sp.]